MLLTTEGVSVVEAAGRSFLQVEPEAMRVLAFEAMRDIAHLLQTNAERLDWASLLQRFGAH